MTGAEGSSDGVIRDVEVDVWQASGVVGPGVGVADWDSAEQGVLDDRSVVLWSGDPLLLGLRVDVGGLGLNSGGVWIVEAHWLIDGIYFDYLFISFLVYMGRWVGGVCFIWIWSEK